MPQSRLGLANAGRGAASPASIGARLIAPSVRPAARRQPWSPDQSHLAHGSGDRKHGWVFEVPLHQALLGSTKDRLAVTGCEIIRQLDVEINRADQTGDRIDIHVL